MSYLENLLGAGSVVDKNKKAADLKAISEKSDAVGLYFSAHWCPPCKGFTPVLAKWYTDHASKKGMEIIFVSSDRDQAAFDDYYAEMPWLALKFENRDLKNKLSKKFGIQGIPSLVILDPKSGTLHTKNGRQTVVSDKEAANYPWPPKQFWKDILGGQKLVNPADDSEIDTESLKNKKYIGIYFSAHWCPPCKAFTPKLADWYKKYHNADSDFEFIFNSWDKTEDQYNDYRKEMPFPARKWDAKSLREGLDDMYEVSGIPTLTIVEAATGKVVCSSGRAGVTENPDEFPWEKKPVNKLGPDSVDPLNGTACMIAFVDDKADIAAIKAAMLPEATKFMEQSKANGEWPASPMAMEFIIDNGSHGLSERVRGLIKRKDDEILAVLDLGKEALTVSGVKNVDGITVEAVAELVAQYKGGSGTVRKLDL